MYTYAKKRSLLIITDFFTINFSITKTFVIDNLEHSYNYGKRGRKRNAKSTEYTRIPIE